MSNMTRRSRPVSEEPRDPPRAKPPRPAVSVGSCVRELRAVGIPVPCPRCNGRGYTMTFLGGGAYTATTAIRVTACRCVS